MDIRWREHESEEEFMDEAPPPPNADKVDHTQGKLTEVAPTAEVETRNENASGVEAVA